MNHIADNFQLLLTYPEGNAMLYGECCVRSCHGDGRLSISEGNSYGAYFATHAHAKGGTKIEKKCTKSYLATLLNEKLDRRGFPEAVQHVFEPWRASERHGMWLRGKDPSARLLGHPSSAPYHVSWFPMRAPACTDMRFVFFLGELVLSPALITANVTRECISCSTLFFQKVCRRAGVLRATQRLNPTHCQFAASNIHLHSSV